MIATMILYADFFGFGGASARINDEDYEDLNVDESTSVKSKADKGEDEERSRVDANLSLWYNHEWDVALPIAEEHFPIRDLTESAENMREWS